MSQELAGSPLRVLLAQIAAGDLTVRGTVSDHNDGTDQMIRDFNHLADTLTHLQCASQEAEQRGNDLLDVMMSVATGDYSRRVTITAVDSIFDALATGLNVLIDELVAGQALQLQLQEAIIMSQATVIQELSTPLIPFSDDVLVMPLIGAIDSARAQQMLQCLLTGIEEHQARVVIIDITGVITIDTQVANGLIRAAQAAQLLGARTVLTGIRPEVAQTMVGLGIDLRQIVIRSTLQSGIAFALESR